MKIEIDLAESGEEFQEFTTLEKWNAYVADLKQYNQDIPNNQPTIFPTIMIKGSWIANPYGADKFAATFLTGYKKIDESLPDPDYSDGPD